MTFSQNKKLSESWIDIANTTLADPTAEIQCPECGFASMEVVDVKTEDGVDRYVKCPECHAVNIITIKNGLGD